MPGFILRLERSHRPTPTSTARKLGPTDSTVRDGSVCTEGTPSHCAREERVEAILSQRTKNQVHKERDKEYSAAEIQ